MVDFTRISDNLPGKRQKFQNMIQAIAIAIDDAQPVEGSGGDTGLDAFVGRIGEDIVSYEAKYFEGRLNSNRRGQVERSLKTVKKKHPNLKKWILATPISFTPGEHTWWQDLVNANPSIEMVLWQERHIENHLNNPKCVGIREEYLPNIVDEIGASSTKSSQEHQRTLGAVERNSQRLRSIQNSQQIVESDIQEILSRMPASETSLEAQKAQEIQRRLEEAKRILNEHKPQTALPLYESILDEVDEVQEGSKALLAKTYNGIAACYLHQGDYTQADGFFLKALERMPEDPKALANVALIKYLLGEAGVGLPYIRRAYQLDPSNVHTVNILARFYIDNGQYEEARCLFTDDILQDPSCMITFGFLLQDCGETDQARLWLRKAADTSPNDPEILMAYAASLFMPIIDQLQAGVLSPIELAQDQKNQLIESEKYLNQAGDILKTSEEPNRYILTLTNKSGVRLALQDAQQALSLAEEALEIDDTDHLCWTNKGMSLIQLRRFDEAESAYIQALDNGSDLIPTTQKLAACRIFKERFDDAISTIRTILPEGEEENVDDSTLPLVMTLLEAFIEGKYFDHAESLLDTLLTILPNNSRILTGYGDLKNKSGELEAAEDFFLQAVRYADRSDKTYSLFKLAQFYLYHKDYEKAEKTLEPIVNLEINNLYLKQYLDCLGNQGKLGRCVEITSNLRQNGLGDAGLLHIEAISLENLGQLQNALQLYSELLEIEPSSSRYHIRKGTCDYRLRNVNSAETSFRKALELGIDDPRDKMIIAQTFSSLRHSWEAITLAYDALQEAIDDPQMHLAYLSLFLQRSPDVQDRLDITTIDVDIEVTFQRNENESQTYLIIPDSKEHTSVNELKVSSRLAQLLLGNTKDYIITYTDPQGSDVTLKILEIKSKFVVAFQKIFSEYNTRFLDQGGLEEIRIRGEDFSEFFRKIDQVAEQTDLAIENYRTLQIPISSFAHMLGRDLFTIWFGLTNTPDLKLRSTFGNKEEEQEEYKLALNSNEIVIDLISLFTLKLTGILELIPRMFNKVYVHQHSLDELNQIIEFYTPTGDGRQRYIGRVDNQYIANEESEESVQNKRSFLQDILQSILDETNVSGLSSEQIIISDELVDFIGKSPTNSLALAKEKNIPLYSDDRVLRRLAKEYEVESFWTQNMLRAAVKKKFLDSLEYRGIIQILLTNNYDLIAINHDDILYALKNSHFDVSHANFVKTISTLKPATAITDQAVNICAEVVKEIWLDPLQQLLVKRDILFALLDILTEERDKVSIARLFIEAVDVQFNLIQLYRDEVINLIETWLKNRLYMN